MSFSPAKLVALVALVLGVAATAISTDPTGYGISDVCLHWLQLGAQITSTVAAWLVVRDPKVESAPTIDPSRFRD